MKKKKTIAVDLSLPIPSYNTEGREILSGVYYEDTDFTWLQLRGFGFFKKPKSVTLEFEDGNIHLANFKAGKSISLSSGKEINAAIESIGEAMISIGDSITANFILRADKDELGADKEEEA